jgi:4-amino-4-deoxy-L-arabinose transferase-like glycosyltransferase
VLTRIAYDVTVGHHLHLGLDSLWYQLMGKQIAGGAGYVDPATLIETGRKVPTANFPPLYPATVALFHSVGFTSVTGQRLAGALLGGISVALTGLLGRRIGGWRLGLPAAALVACWPPLIAGDGSLMSENLAVPAVLAATLATVVAVRDGGLARWALAGVLLGTLCLVRSELPLTAACLILFAACCGGFFNRGVRRPWAGLALSLVIVVALVLPWSLSRRAAVGSEALLPTNGAKTFAGANCPQTYGGSQLGGWSYACVATADETARAATENQRASIERRAGERYATAHESRLPLVLVARELRTAGIWSPGALIAVDIQESRNSWWDRLAWYCGILALPLGLFGCGILARREPIVLAPVVALVIGALVTYGNPRLRLPVEPILLIAVAATCEYGLEKRSRGRRAAALSRID